MNFQVRVLNYALTLWNASCFLDILLFLCHLRAFRVPLHNGDYTVCVYCLKIAWGNMTQLCIVLISLIALRDLLVVERDTIILSLAYIFTIHGCYWEITEKSILKHNSYIIKKNTFIISICTHTFSKLLAQLRNNCIYFS